MTSPSPLAAVTPRSVLLVVEDATLAEILGEALEDAGHHTRLVEGADGVAAALAAGRFDAAIVDLDTRARTGINLLVTLRETAPAMTVIVLLPCGGLPRAAPDCPITSRSRSRPASERC